MITTITLLLTAAISIISYRLGAGAANRVWIVAAACGEGVFVEGRLFAVCTVKDDAP